MSSKPAIGCSTVTRSGKRSSARLAVGGRHADPRAGQRRQRVQQAQADAVALEGRVGDAVEGERQRAVGGALDGRVPGERHGVVPVLGAVAAAERVGAASSANPDEARRNRAPGVVAHRAVDAPHHFAPADVDVADVAGLDDQRQRAGADGQALGQRRVAAVDEAGRGAGVERASVTAL